MEEKYIVLSFEMDMYCVDLLLKNYPKKCCEVTKVQ